MSEFEARVTRRAKNYKISEAGREVIAKFLEQPEIGFTLYDLGPNDRADLTVYLDDPSHGTSLIHLDLPAHLMEEVAPGIRRNAAAVTFEIADDDCEGDRNDEASA